MLRKSLIAALGFLGLFLAGTAAGTAPASAGYACGPWNNFCRPVCAPWNGWCGAFFINPGYSYGWYGHGGHGWGKSYGHNYWDDWHKGNGRHHGHASKNWKHYD